MEIGCQIIKHIRKVAKSALTVWSKSDTDCRDFRNINQVARGYRLEKRNFWKSQTVLDTVVIVNSTPTIVRPRHQSEERSRLGYERRIDGPS